MLYKITCPDLTTYQGFRYEPGVWTPTLSGTGDLCGPGWYHAYTHPGLALLLNPIHGGYHMPFRLWKAEGTIGLSDHGRKVGTTRLRLDRELAIPAVTTDQRVHFAILAALAVYPDPAFGQWTENWLSGADRTEAAATAAAEAARAAAEAAWAAPWAVEAAATAATEAARAAVWAAAEEARAAGWAAGEAAWAAAEAAREAAGWAALALPKWAETALINYEFLPL